MPGTDLDVHALGANIRALEKQIGDMRDESREWREQQLKIYESFASNQKTLGALSQRHTELSHRLADCEREISALTAWRWKSVGILTGVMIVINWITSNA